MSDTGVKKTKGKAVVCFSGGLDSTVLLAMLKEEGYECYALSVNYGQRHVRELMAANKIVARYEIPHAILELASLSRIMLGSSQTDAIPVPEGHYTDETMKATVVPNRNMILLSLATAWAVSLKADVVAYAAHAGDHAIYPDCRPQFIDAMERAIVCCDWNALRSTRRSLTVRRPTSSGSDMTYPSHWR